MILLSIGTNIGNREENIANAITALGTIGKVLSVSDIYTSEPWGFESENGFFNIALTMESALSPLDLLRATQQIERDLGRTAKTTTAYADRVIDIDIIDYDNQIIDYRVQSTDAPYTKTVPLSKGDELAERRGSVIPHSSLLTPHFIAKGSKTLSSSLLTLPHPLMHLRNFVLYPLADIAPDWEHPQLHLTTQELKTNSPDTSIPYKYPK